MARSLDRFFIFSSILIFIRVYSSCRRQGLQPHAHQEGIEKLWRACSMVPPAMKSLPRGRMSSFQSSSTANSLWLNEFAGSDNE